MAQGGDSRIGQEQGADNPSGGIGNGVVQSAGLADIGKLAERVDGSNDLKSLGFQIPVDVVHLDFSMIACLNL